MLTSVMKNYIAKNRNAMKKMTLIKLSGLLLLNICMLSCEKSEDSGEFDDIGGSLLYTFSGSVHQLDLASNNVRDFFLYNTYGFGDWSLSHDHEYRLISEREAGEYRATKFSLVNNSDHTIVREFNYYNPLGNATGVTGYLSPDNSKVLIQPTNESGVVIADLNGEHLHHFQRLTIDGASQPITVSDEALWLPDHSILFLLGGQYMVKLSPPYQHVSIVHRLSGSEWDKLAVNRAGTHAVLRSNFNIWVMHVEDGTLRQVTEDDWFGLSAQFSPDGKHLIVAKRFDDVGRFNLAIVPNDGGSYDLENSDAVRIIQPSGQNIYATVNGSFYWIP